MITPHTSSPDDLFGIFVLAILLTSIATLGIIHWRDARREHERRVRDRRRGSAVFNDMGIGMPDRRKGERRKSHHHGS